MPREDSEDKLMDQDDQRSDFLEEEENNDKLVKSKAQRVVEADDEKEDTEIYDGSLELKIDEVGEKQNGEVVEEIDHEPWGKEPDYGYQYDKEVHDLFVVLISIVRFFSPWLVIDLFNNFAILFFADFVYLKFKRAVIDFRIFFFIVRFNNSLSF